MKKLICSTCKEEKDENYFSLKTQAKKRGRSAICKSCHNEYSRTHWYPKNKEIVKEKTANYRKNNAAKSLASDLKISIEEAEKLVNRGKVNCDICSSTKRLAFDHCHKTNKARGVLCFSCNTLLGRLGDSKESIEDTCLKFKEYLTKDNFN